MYKYLDKVREKPAHHRRRFAFLTSSTITLFIFGIWSLAMFGGSGGSTVADSRDENSPFESFTANVGSALDTFKSDFDNVWEKVESVDLESEYSEMRQDALDTYER